MVLLDEIIPEALLAEMVAERYVNVTRHPTADLAVYNYGQRAQFDNVWNEATLACRGLIANGDGEVVARPFRKFFNLSQLAVLPDGPFTATEKMDGSLGIAYRQPKGSTSIATRGSFASDQAQWATFWLNTHQGHLRSVFDAAEDGCTMLFEIIYPSNRIVVDYGDRAELVYLTSIDNASGADVDDWDKPWRWPGHRAASHPGLDIDTVMAMEQPNTEGFVLRWSDGTRAKVKFAEYLRLHKLLTGVNARTIWELRANGHALTDLLEVVPDEFYRWVAETDAKLHADYEAIETEALAGIERVPNVGRREQAELIKTMTYPAVVFSMLDGKNYAPLIWKLIRPSASVPFKQDNDS